MVSVVDSLVEIFDQFRKPGKPGEDLFDSIGRGVLEQRIGYFMDKGDPIEFVMSAFPAKSPNHQLKTLGCLPDGAEEVAFRNFGRFSEMASDVYQPGVVIRVITDGLVFRDMVGISEEEVYVYHQGCVTMTKDAPVVLMTLLDLFGDNLTIESALQLMIDRFGQTEEQINQRIENEEDTRMLYCGLSKFMQTDIVWPEGLSRSQVSKRSGLVGKQMLMRSEAYSAFITHRYPRAVRLSCHPSTNAGNKFSWQFIPGNNDWNTPWHNVLCVVDGRYSLRKRFEAESNLGLELVYKNNQPYYYRDRPSAADLV